MTNNTDNLTIASNLKTNYTTIDAYKTYFNWIWFLFGCYILLAIISSLYIAISGVEDGNNSYVLTYTSATLSPLMFFALFCWQNRGKRYDVKKCLGVDKKLSIGNILISIAISIVAIICFAQITAVFDYSLELIGYNPSDEIPLLYTNFGYLILNLLLLAVLPAICEELVFRGIILNGLKQEHSPAAAILISAALFTLMHGSLQQTLYQFILGTFLAILMYYTANILYPIIAHFINNAVVIVANYIAFQNGNTTTSTDPVTTSQIVIAFVLSIIGLLVMYLIIRYYLKPRNKENHKYNDKFKNIMTYTIEERHYAVISISIAIVMWLINTIYTFTV